jgi:hypothetical protein
MPRVAQVEAALSMQEATSSWEIPSSRTRLMPRKSGLAPRTARSLAQPQTHR